MKTLFGRDASTTDASLKLNAEPETERTIIQLWLAGAVERADGVLAQSLSWTDGRLSCTLVNILRKKMDKLW